MMCACTITMRRTARTSSAAGSAPVARSVRRQARKRSVGRTDSNAATRNSTIFTHSSQSPQYQDAPLMP